MLAGASLDANTPSSSKSSVNSSNHSGISRNRSPWTGTVSSFFSVSVESCNWFSNARLRVLRLRVDAGLGVESSAIESCDADVEDVVVHEVDGSVDNPGTTRST